jgi:hypothetical protein
MYTHGMIICVDNLHESQRSYWLGVTINVDATHDQSATCQKVKHDWLHLYIWCIH